MKGKSKSLNIKSGFSHLNDLKVNQNQIKSQNSQVVMMRSGLWEENVKRLKNDLNSDLDIENRFLTAFSGYCSPIF